METNLRIYYKSKQLREGLMKKCLQVFDLDILCIDLIENFQSSPRFPAHKVFKSFSFSPESTSDMMIHIFTSPLISATTLSRIYSNSPAEF